MRPYTYAPAFGKRAFGRRRTPSDVPVSPDDRSSYGGEKRGPGVRYRNRTIERKPEKGGGGRHQDCVRMADTEPRRYEAGWRRRLSCYVTRFGRENTKASVLRRDRFASGDWGITQIGMRDCFYSEMPCEVWSNSCRSQ